MTIGALKYRVRIQEPSLTPDGSGGFTEAWQDIAEDPEVFAAILPVQGRESFRQRKLSAPATHRVIIRYRADVTAAMRVLHAGAAYDVIALLPVGEMRYLELMARAVAQ